MTMNTTAPTYADEQQEQQQQELEQQQQQGDDSIPAVASSSGSCIISVTSCNKGGDVGSVGSSSTKTRFSFYNAQEVKLEETQTAATKEDEEVGDASPPKANPQSEIATTTTTKEGNGGEGCSSSDGMDDKNTIETQTAASQKPAAAAGDQRFNFYVAADGSTDVKDNPSTSTEDGKEEDDRRSPHTPPATSEDEDSNGNKRTPAVVAASVCSTSEAVTTNGSDKTSPAPPAPEAKTTTTSTAATTAQVSTPQRSNNAASASSAQKKKQKAVQAAAARARNNSKIKDRNASTTGSAAAAAAAAVDIDNKGSTSNNDNKMDSVEILRSLKDTEQMRYNLMKECEPTSAAAATAAATVAVAKSTSASASTTSRDNVSSKNNHDIANNDDDDDDADGVESHTSQEIYQDADTFDSDGLQQQALQLQQVMERTGGLDLASSKEVTSTATTTTTEQHPQAHTSSTYNDYRNTLQRPATTVPGNGGGDNSSAAGAGNNPYEDAIREALDLLRKHRPPSPQQHLQNDDATMASGELPDNNNDDDNNNLAIDMNVVQGATSSPMMRSPRDADRVMQSRWESPHQHDQQELDARRKERQERMARYTSRLAELKNNEEGYKPTPTAASASEEESASFHSNMPQSLHASADNNDQSQEPSRRVSPPPSAVDGIPATCPSGDSASCDASSLSASNYGNSQANPKEVHRSVERVLLAILERAHSNGRATQASNGTLTATGSHASLSVVGGGASTRSNAPSSYRLGGEEKKSPNRLGSPATQPPVDEDSLLRAVGDLLSSSGVGSSSVLSGSAASPPRRSDGTEQSNTTTGTRRSVVEELLAEAESFGGDQAAATTRNAGSGSQSLTEKKHTKGDAEDLLNCSTGVEAVRSEANVNYVVVDRGLDELVMKTLGKSPSKQKQKRRTESPTTDEDEDETGDNDGEEEKSEAVESQTRTGSYDDDVDDDDDDDTYDDDSQDESGEDLDDALEGVLGPLNRQAGGTTGVVLESNLSPDRSNGEQSIFDSLSNAMSSLVASAISGDEKQSLASGHASKISVRDKYATISDHDENGEDVLDEVDEQSSSRSSVDEEASELMRSLCAHLLPFGVDQSSRFLDEVPQWDDENSNEAGYRIIRLTNLQLQRVEHAFEAMVHGLKKISEQNLIAEGSQKNIDASFERDLAVAEKALDQEEAEDRTTAIMKALHLVPKAPSDKEKTAGASADIESDNDDGNASVDDTVSVQPDVCHPDFPGIHSAGKGEMGDLEYFQLPIIFKSHVTGFEPTKDMFLEAGNVVAGQYLVESELGTAAFSTAYRCVDLNSEGDDTEDGHQEVCLKVIKNTKDFFDQSLDEIKILELLRQTGKCQENNIIEMKTFFYHREHLVIVTELLRQNLFEFGKFILDHDEEPYFTLPRLGYITRQCLVALRFVHKLGLVHSDIKPENLLLGSYSRAQVKVIDFGSSCYLTDRQSSYIQSRSYRAPEVVLGLPYDGKIDVWSLGCVIAEMLTGEVTFQNDSMVSMLSRIEAICGPFPRHMIAQGRQSDRFFTKCGLLFEKVSGGGGEDDGQKTPDVSEDEDEDSDVGRSSRAVFDIFQPKTTTLSARLGFPANLHERYMSGAPLSPTEKKQAMFVDFVRKILTIDPDARPSAGEALKHPWMVYASTLAEEDIKYPSQ